MHEQGHFEDHVNQLERDALALEHSDDSSRVHLLFRTVHNLKSSLAQADLEALAEQAHRLEDELDHIRRGRRRWTSLHCDQVMALVDGIRNAIGQGAGFTSREVHLEKGPQAPELHWGMPMTAGQVEAVESAVAGGAGLYRLDKLFRRGLSREAFEDLPVLEDLRELGTLVAVHPEFEAFDAGPEDQVVQFLFLSQRSEAELSTVLWDPLLCLAEPGASGVCPAEPVEQPERVPREGLRFLVVEDDPTAGSLLQYILAQHGNCLLCETGAEGLSAVEAAYAKNAPFDLVILDLFLPDVHGDEILREIRHLEAQKGLSDSDERTHVLINTASRDMDQLRQSLGLEPDGYLLKPVNVDALLRRIAELRARL